MKQADSALLVSAVASAVLFCGKGTRVAIEAFGNNLLKDERGGGVVVTIRDL